MQKLVFKLIVSITVLSLIVSCGGDKKKKGSRRDFGNGDTSSVATPTVAATGTASVSGTITFEGDPPTMKKLDMSAEPVCHAKHDGAARSKTLVLGDGNTIANIFVKVVSGIPAGATYDPPAEVVTLDQVGCVYVPHVIGVMVGQQISILNSDGIMHNVHAIPSENAEFNKAMPKSKTEIEYAFDKVEENPFPIKCDVHPWMGGFVGVMSHPFFDVTEKDGKFVIKNLPAGTYEIEAWHEKLGSKKVSVTVADGESKTADFAFSR